MHALLSHRENKTELGSQCSPGGRKRKEEDGRTRCIIREEEERQQENQSHPPNCFISLCKMSTAIVLPLCWGKKIQEHGGLLPREEGHEDSFACPCPFSRFSELWRGRAGPEARPLPQKA